MQGTDTVFLFSGQGSHYFRMGQELFEADGTFRGWMRRLDAIARDALGESVVDALYSPRHRKGDAFERTSLTHPAIFMVEYALAQALIAAGLRPDRVIGVSLGSFAAAAVAGSVEAEHAMKAVLHQALALEKHCEPGGMIAVMAEPALFEAPFLHQCSELAAVNFHSHFIVSTPRAELDAIEAELQRRGLSHQRLPVSFAFHSRWIDRAEQAFGAVARTIPCTPPNMPLTCCEQVRTLDTLPGEFFWRVVRRPIRFHETITMMEREGAYRYIDIGPTGTLATFLKYALPPASASTKYAILTPFGRDLKNMADVLAAGRA